MCRSRPFVCSFPSRKEQEFVGVYYSDAFFWARHSWVGGQVTPVSRCMLEHPIHVVCLNVASMVAAVRLSRYGRGSLCQKVEQRHHHPWRSHSTAVSQLWTWSSCCLCIVGIVLVGLFFGGFVFQSVPVLPTIFDRNAPHSSWKSPTSPYTIFPVALRSALRQKSQCFPDIFV